MKNSRYCASSTPIGFTLPDHNIRQAQQDKETNMASKIVGIAMQNFTAAPNMPDAQALIDYAVRMEQLGYESVWVWDHILLGVDPYFPILDALSVLTAVAARTETIRLGTGILVLPARNPVVLAKQLSSIDQISNCLLYTSPSPRDRG